MKNFKLLALSGGVGGAKLVCGLSQVLNNKQLQVIANTADDFEHLGLSISPDLDSVMYAMAGLNNEELGWGVKGETWQFMSAIKRMQGEAWFNLGDQDLATHILRTEMLKQGRSLSDVTANLFRRLDIQHSVLPMCDEKVSTRVATADGELSFQHYFVKEQCKISVTGFRFAGVEQATLGDKQKQAIESADAVLICPSNPFVSVAPILAVPGLKAAIIKKQKPLAVVSPIIAGQAVKGPAAKMMQELKMPVSALAVAKYYQDFASHFVLDQQDAHLKTDIEQLGMQVLVCQTLMQSAGDKIALAQQVCDWLYEQ